MDQVKSPLKWAGGKANMVPIIKDLWQGHEDRMFISPFLGGGSVELALNPASIVVSDLNSSLVNFWRHLKRGKVMTISEFREAFCAAREEAVSAWVDQGKSEDHAVYLAMRDRLNEIRTTHKGLISAEHASLFYCISRNSFNALWRTRKDGVYMNVPPRDRWDNGANSFEGWRERIQRWLTFHCDWKSLEYPDEAFIYADPPYHSIKNGFTSYAGEFSWSDQAELAKQLSIHAGPVVLHNAATPAIIGLYEELEFELIYVNGSRRISANGDRTPEKELIAIKNI